MNMLVGFEVGSQAQFNARYRGPTWAGGASGVTFGIGFDVGYSTPAEIRQVWGPYLPAAMVEAMCSAAGKTGAAGQEACFRLRGTVTVSWTAAMAVFQNHDMPKWEAIVEKALPNTDALSPDSFGALVSLAYNRGASFSEPGDRYLEMREIHANMASRNFTAIPGNIRAMERLWPTVRGLQIRRQQEAELFQRGLENSPVTSPKASATTITVAAEAPSKPAPTHGYDVKWIQASLNRLGADPQLTVDGQYGPSTLATVKEFQEAKGLQVDGIAGKQTLDAIAAAILSAP
jgi:GH24 family phage-related lysozyme (muramidase)